MSKIFKFNYHWLNELSKHKDMLDNDTRILVTYIEVLQQENKQLNSILTELEEHCEVMLRIFETMSEEQKQEQLDKYVIYDKFLGRIQELKEKYKC